MNKPGVDPYGVSITTSRRSPMSVQRSREDLRTAAEAQKLGRKAEEVYRGIRPGRVLGKGGGGVVGVWGVCGGAARFAACGMLFVCVVSLCRKQSGWK